MPLEYIPNFSSIAGRQVGKKEKMPLENIPNFSSTATLVAI